MIIFGSVVTCADEGECSEKILTFTAIEQANLEGRLVLLADQS